MKQIPIGLQLYSVRDDCARDFPGTLAAVAEMGYAGVEFAGYYGRTARELRGLLDGLGLHCCGTHPGLDTLLGDELPRTLEFNQELGNRFLIVPGLAEPHRNSRAAWLNTARLMNEAAERAQAQGMHVGYHNHTGEFKLLEGIIPFEVFFGATLPGVVMQLDIGWATAAGRDATALLKQYAGRALTVHVKEHSATNPNALLGEGEVPWAEVFPVCESIGGTEWYIVEQETYPYGPLESVDRCLQNLRRLGK